ASRRPPPGPAPATPSREAKQRAAAILEVWAGVRTPADAAQALGVSRPRYYLLEEQALGGLLTACEPQPRGPHVDAARRCQALGPEWERGGGGWGRQQARVGGARARPGSPRPARHAGQAHRREATETPAHCAGLARGDPLAFGRGGAQPRELDRGAAAELA